LEKNFPIIGKNAKIFSNHWKTAEKFFQSLEKPPHFFQPLEKNFPIIGKPAFSPRASRLCKTRRVQGGGTAAFASAITDILFDNFAALREALGIIDGLAMYNDAKNIVTNELHKPAGSSARIIAAIKEDAQQAGGDKDYTIDIGV
jgi:hypothetical protein